MSAISSSHIEESGIWNATRPINNVVRLNNQHRAVVSEPNYAWSTPTKEKLNALVSKLQRNWDGYGSEPVSFLNAHFAYQVLERICLANTPAPAIVPGSTGDLQLEWHTFAHDLEIHVIAPNKVLATFSTVHADGSESEESLDLDNDFTKVALWVKEMLEDRIAPITSAA